MSCGFKKENFKNDYHFRDLQLSFGFLQFIATVWISKRIEKRSLSPSPSLYFVFSPLYLPICIWYIPNSPSLYFILLHISIFCIFIILSLYTYFVRYHVYVFVVFICAFRLYPLSPPLYILCAHLSLYFYIFGVSCDCICCIDMCFQVNHLVFCLFQNLNM